MGVIKALYTVLGQSLDLIWRDRSATAAKHPDMAGAKLPQAINHVAKKFNVPALIGTNGKCVGILLNGSPHDVVNTAIMAKVNDFSATCLN